MPVEGNGGADTDEILGSSSYGDGSMSDSSDRTRDVRHCPGVSERRLLAGLTSPQRLKVQKKMKEERRLKSIQDKKVKEGDKKVKLLEANQGAQHLELLDSQRRARAAMFKRHQTERVRLGCRRLYEDTQEHIDRCRRLRRVAP